MKKIFEPVILRHLALKNRLVRSATSERLATETGVPSEAMIALYEALGKGGVAAVITGYTAIDAQEPGSAGMTRMDREELVDGWKPLVDVLHKYDCRAIMQLGLRNYVREERALEPDDCSPEDLAAIVQLYGDAARRAKAAGFDGVQIHAAHSMWLARFLRPGVNHRLDEYGCSTGNRARILREILSCIRRKAGGLHVSVKLNGRDVEQGGMTLPEALGTALVLVRGNIDSIEVSGVRASEPNIIPGKNEACFLPLAKMIKRDSSVPVILAGGNRSVENMERILNEDGIDLLAMSRPLIREPDLPQRWKAGKLTPAKCPSCNACHTTQGRRCLFVLRGVAG